MSGKRAIGAYNKGKQREHFDMPAWMVEQNARCKTPNAPRERFKKLPDLIERLNADAVPQGFVLVPIEPTDAMLSHFAGMDWRKLSPDKQAAEIAAYSRMLAAAPKSEEVTRG